MDDPWAVVQEGEPTVAQQPVDDWAVVQQGDVPTPQNPQVLSGQKPVFPERTPWNPKAEFTKENAVESAWEVTGASAIATAMGVFAPELITGAGMVAGAFPLSAPLAIPLITFGRAMRGKRLLAASAGLISGATSEIGGQAAKYAGAGETTQELARLGGGVATEGVRGLGWVAGKALQAPALSIPRKVIKESLKAGLKALDIQPGALKSDRELAFVEKEILRLRGEGLGTPLDDVYAGLQSGSDTARYSAGEKAATLIRNAEEQASKIITKARMGPVARRQDAVPKLKEIGRDVLEAANLQRMNIGPDRELSEVGGTLRAAIMERKNAIAEVRANQYKVDELARDKIVAGREKAGDFIENHFDFKKIVADLEKKILSTAEARESSTAAEVTEPGLIRAKMMMLEALRGRKVTVGAEEAETLAAKGLRVKQTSAKNWEVEYPSSFKAVDELRRKLGTVFTKQPAEGFEAIGEASARKYYKEISDVQKQYAGREQAELLENYAQSSEHLKSFRTKKGKVTTAIDKYDDAEFATDAGKLPTKYFGSPEGVRALHEMVKDPKIIQQGAREFASNQLRDKSFKQVESWLTKNTEFTKMFPAVGATVRAYAKNVQRAERIFNNTQDAIVRVERDAAGITKTAATEGNRAIARGEAEGAKAVALGESASRKILGNKFPADRVRQLIESGDPTQWEAVREGIANTPQARKSFGMAVRQVVADRAMKSPDSVLSFFNEKIKPALQGTGFMNASDMAMIERKLANITSGKIPERFKTKMMQRFLASTFAGYASTVPTRAVGTAVEALDESP